MEEQKREMCIRDSLGGAGVEAKGGAAVGPAGAGDTGVKGLAEVPETGFGQLGSLLDKFLGHALAGTAHNVKGRGQCGDLSLIHIYVVEHRLNIRRYTLHAKAVLFGTAMLLAGSTVLFYILEADASFAGMTAPQRLLAAFFQAVTPRTAGFNAVDLTQLSEGGALLTMLQMCIRDRPEPQGLRRWP